MKLVRQWARKYGVQEPIVESEKKDKKLKVKHDGKWIHFGQTGYQDYTTHRDDVRQKAYCKRAAGIRGKDGRRTGDDPGSANFYAMRLLWDCTP